MTIDGDYLWIAYGDGIIHWDLRDNSHELFEVSDRDSGAIPIQVAVSADGIIWTSFMNGDIKYSPRSSVRFQYYFSKFIHNTSNA